jgi:DNA-binding transcriptional LysR family regulator
MLKPLAGYLQRYPRVRVEWLLHDDRAIDDYVAAGIDCAIQVGDVSDPNLVVIRLSQVRRIVAVAPAVLEGRPWPEQPEALTSLPWVALHTYYRNEVVLQRVADGVCQHLPIQPRMSTDSLYALRSAACAGLGVCVGSAWALADDVAAGRLVQLVPEWQAAPLPVNLVYPWARHYPARLRSFVEWMRTAMPGVVEG